jgi:hypothetical protein
VVKVVETGEVAGAGKATGAADAACSLFAQAGFTCLFSDSNRLDSKVGSPFHEVRKFLK